MQKTVRKISSKQFMSIFTLGVVAHLVRVLTNNAALAAHQAVWVSVLVSVVPMALIGWLMIFVAKKFQGYNLAQINVAVFSKPIGTVINIIMLLWMVFITACNLCLLSERILFSILPDTSVLFIISAALIAVLLVVMAGMENFAKLSQLLFYIFISIFVVISASALFFSFDINNLLPVSTLDTVPVTLGALQIISVWGSFIYYFNFCDRIKYEKFEKRALVSLGITAIIGITIIAVTVGTVGYSMLGNLVLPFTTVIKNLNSNSIDTFKLFDIALFSIWIMADVVLVCVSALIFRSIFATVFKVKNKNRPVYVLFFIYFILTLVFESYALKILNIGQWAVFYVNLSFFFALPVILFLTGKLRKKF